MEPYIWVGIILAVSGTVAEIVRYSKMGSSKLMKAAERGDLEAFRRLLGRSGAKVDAPGALGNRPLHVAAGEWGREQGLVETVIALGATVDVRNLRGQTPLHLAVERGNLEAARLLLENGADMGVKDRDGVTPMQLAFKKRRKRVVSLLERFAGR